MQPLHSNEARWSRLREIDTVLTRFHSYPPPSLSFPALLLSFRLPLEVIGRCETLLRDQQLTCRRNTMSDLLNVSPRYPVPHSFWKPFRDVKLTQKSALRLYFVTFKPRNVTCFCVIIHQHSWIQVRTQMQCRLSTLILFYQQVWEPKISWRKIHTQLTLLWYISPPCIWGNVRWLRCRPLQTDKQMCFHGMREGA